VIMDIKKRDFLTTSLGIGAGLAAASSLTSAQAQERNPALHANTQPSTMDSSYKPRRINKAIELWEDGQPIYYNGSGMGPGVDPYAQGVKMARTWMDAINVEDQANLIEASHAVRVAPHRMAGGYQTRVTCARTAARLCGRASTFIDG